MNRPSARTQLGCQELCELNRDCVGIAYSYELQSDNSNTACYLCLNHELVDYKEFDFYRRPGMMKRYNNPIILVR